ncbi:DNA adenine methylase [Exiguobacterium sp. RIT341]|uniref:DNA adenine methylase n=1 Tax=Exiguobacterium sp. RIT341 TaxID=1470592 RepID=UPI0004498A54|nr:DNA adenine methylase [Exiguobacterium sp. RIT341]EZP58375.1 Modification methylase DpnIIA [Exiguobacterium sp. RIT341]
MPTTDSPFRYPGGKSQLKKFIVELFEYNDLNEMTYIEPFAGGGGLALSLLYSGNVNNIIINDYDIAIWSVWKSILFYPKDFIRLIDSTEITVEEWKKQKQIYTQMKQGRIDKRVKIQVLTLAFATFFLNRTNRSGIIKGGMIGGIEQNSKDKIDCRFNKKKLISKIKKISSYSNSIRLYNLDAEIFIKKVIMSENPKNTFVFFDPPYYKKGPNLYSDFYNPRDHQSLGKKVQSNKLTCSWITTYDCCDEIKRIYSNSYGLEYKLNYSLATKKRAKELIYFSKNLRTCKKYVNLDVTVYD